jgi:hypothetical protein
MVTAPEDRCRVVGRGPNWLFVRATASRPPQAGEPSLVEQVWDLSSKHFVYRVVLEMQAVEVVDQRLASELHELHDLLAEHAGALRLCGLRPELAAPVLAAAHCESLHNHVDRHAAIVGGPCIDRPVVRASRPSQRVATPVVRHVHPRVNRLGVVSHHEH